MKKSPLFLAILLVIAGLLAGCEPSPREVLYEIDLAKADLPNGVIELSGFHDVESWGRWTNPGIATAAKVKFANPLPKNFVVVIEGQAMEGRGEGSLVAGSFTDSFYIHGVKDVVKVFVEQHDTVDVLEISAASPASPKEIGVNNDTRRLGLGLMKIYIEAL